MMLMLLCCLALGGFTAAYGDLVERAAPKDLITALAEEGNFKTITYFLNSSGLLAELSNVTAFPEITLYLPTDDVITAAPAELMAQLNDPIYLSHLLRFHILPHDALKMTHANDKTYDTMALQPLRINWYKLIGVYSAEGVEVVPRNIQIENGYIHALKGIMVPPMGNIPYLIAQRPDMRILTSLLHVASLTDTIKDDENMTIFAPTDAAFGRMSNDAQKYLQSNPDTLREVLLYHIVDKTTLYSIGMRHSMTFQTADQKHDRVMLMEDGTGHMFLNGGMVSQVDISATNGVIHVLDHVMVPVRVLLDMESHGITVVG